MEPDQSRRFDGWLFRADTGELIKGGTVQRLQDQPRQILDALLSCPGGLVTREQLIARLWPRVVVDFDTGINSAIRKLRVALGDDAEAPRYIETIPRRGYRFIGRLEAVPLTDERGSPESVGHPPAGHGQVEANLRFVRWARQYRRHLYAAAGLVLVVVLALFTPARFRDEAVATKVPLPAHQTPPTGGLLLAIPPFSTGRQDEDGLLVAAVVTDLVRNRFAANPLISVIAAAPVEAGGDGESLPFAGGVGARFLLRGHIDGDENRLSIAMRLIDTEADDTRWAKSFDSSGDELADLRDEVHAQVSSELAISASTAAGTTPSAAPINIDSYKVYVRGLQLMESQRARDAERAVELFRRATILDPDFARGHLALSQALVLANATLAKPRSENAVRSVERALELDPSMGEAWVELARFEPDVAQAENLYRKGLDLSPSNSLGHIRYGEFLWDRGRTGESIELMERAILLDPQNTRAMQRLAYLAMVRNSDIELHKALHRRALEVDPRLASSLGALAYSSWEYSGDFAEAARSIEAALVLDPDSPWLRQIAMFIYLDLDDLAAAMHVARESPDPVSQMVQAQYAGNRRRAGELAMAMDGVWTTGPASPGGESLRDQAIESGQFGAAREKIEAVFTEEGEGMPPRMPLRGTALVYAHLLMLAGETERGHRLAETTLDVIEGHSVGRPADWFSRERASGYMLLGDVERALQELSDNASSKRTYRWWYLVRHDPLFAPLRDDERFQAIVRQVDAHTAEQRTLLDELRRKGLVPERPQRAPVDPSHRLDRPRTPAARV